jgi:hypothetical protein
MWPFDKKDISPAQQSAYTTGTGIKNLPQDMPAHWVGAGAGGSASNSITIADGSTLSPQQLSSILSGGLLGISIEEREELAKLKIQYEEERKLVKLTEFKKLPNELRQFVLNAFAWQAAVQTINNADVGRSERLRELIGKENMGKIWSTQAQGFNFPSISSIALPEGLSLEDIKRAHLEQSLEEELFNGK